MTWGESAIHGAYLTGEAEGASHMIVCHTTVDFEQMAIYVKPGEDPRVVWQNHVTSGNGYTALDEVYQYKLGWDRQKVERRALHWEYERPPKEAIA